MTLYISKEIIFSLQQVVLFDILEILIGRHLQLIGSLFVADDNTMLVHLKGPDGPHVVDSSLDSCLKGTCLTVTVDQNHDLTGIHHGTHTDSKSVSRHILGLASEETAVGNAGVGGKGLHAGTAAQRTAGLVEGNMTIGAYTSDEQVDATCLGNHLLIVTALGGKVGGVTVEDMDVLLSNGSVTRVSAPFKRRIFPCSAVDGNASRKNFFKKIFRAILNGAIL